MTGAASLPLTNGSFEYNQYHIGYKFVCIVQRDAKKDTDIYGNF
jgi:hypothetical protein